MHWPSISKEAAMTKEYQTRHSKNILPRAVYMKTIYQIRDYHRLKENLSDIMDEQPAPRQPQVSISNKGSLVETKAIKRERDMDIVTGIDKAIETIPEEYRHGVWQAVMYNSPYPEDAALSTYSKYKAEFIIRVAMNLGFI